MALVNMGWSNLREVGRARVQHMTSENIFICCVVMEKNMIMFNFSGGFYIIDCILYIYICKNWELVPFLLYLNHVILGSKQQYGHYKEMFMMGYLNYIRCSSVCAIVINETICLSFKDFIMTNNIFFYFNSQLLPPMDQYCHNQMILCWLCMQLPHKLSASMTILTALLRQGSHRIYTISHLITVLVDLLVILMWRIIVCRNIL